MADWKVPLADVRVSEDEIAAVAATYRSGWLSMGPETEAFEEEFARYLGVRHAFATSSGTAALHLLVSATGIRPGDEVIVPSMTFVATVNAIAYLGAKPVFCDIGELSRPWITAERADALVGPRTRAILTMPYGGHPGDTAELAELASDRGLLLLVDAAHALGSRISEHAVGALGDGAAFSFFSNKNLAIGEGGMVVTDDDAVAETIRLLRSHGMTTLTWDRHRGHASAYDVVALGYNYRIDEPRATLGRIRLACLDAENDRRAAAAEQYRSGLADVVGLTVTAAAEPGSTTSDHLFTAVLDHPIDRAAFRRSLAEVGIQTSVHYPPVHTFSIYAGEATDLPLTDAYGARTVTLPLFAHITHEQVDSVMCAVRRGVAAQALSRKG